MVRKNSLTDPCPPEIAEALGLLEGATVADAVQAIGGEDEEQEPAGKGPPGPDAAMASQALADGGEVATDDAASDKFLRILFGDAFDAATKKIREDAHLSDDAPMSQVQNALFAEVKKRTGQHAALAAHAVSRLTPSEKRRCAERGLSLTDYAATKAKVSLTARELKICEEMRCTPEAFAAGKAEAQLERTKR